MQEVTPMLTLTAVVPIGVTGTNLAVSYASKLPKPPY